jgi:hypothetical protein
VLDAVQNLLQEETQHATLLKTFLTSTKLETPASAEQILPLKEQKIERPPNAPDNPVRLVI